MLRRLTQSGVRVFTGSALVLTVALVAVAAAAGHAFGGGGGTGKFAATFDARAVGDPSIDFCRGLGPGGQKLEGRYGGTMTVAGEEYAFNFTTLEALVDRSAGVGTAEGRWQLTDPRTSEIVGRGQLVATVTGDPQGEATQPDPDLQLHGLLVGLLEPSDPDMPALRLLGNFSASLDEGATFPHLKGTVGDPSVGDPSVGDPSVGDPSVGDPTGLAPAVVMPSDPC